MTNWKINKIFSSCSVRQFYFCKKMEYYLSQTIHNANCMEMESSYILVKNMTISQL